MAKFTEALADTPFNRRLAIGHEARHGHTLDAVRVSDDGLLWHTIRYCCGETVPDTVGVWKG